MLAIETLFCHHESRELKSRHRLTYSARPLASVAAALFLAVSLSPAQAGMSRYWEESGQASWYGPGFQGKRTSSGDTFDQHAMTAAHDTLPLGTKVLVTTQETGLSTVVTITDRLPPKRLRIIDLSKAAAAKLGLIASGVGMVTLSVPTGDEPVEVAEAPDDSGEASPQLHGRRHTRHAAQTVSARRACCRAPSAAPVRR